MKKSIPLSAGPLKTSECNLTGWLIKNRKSKLVKVVLLSFNCSF